MFQGPLQEGMVRRAVQDGVVAIYIHDLRTFAIDRHSMTDDRPFGGGEGMVMKPEPIGAALSHVQKIAGDGGRVVLLSPGGCPYSQQKARQLADEAHLVLLCGRYEGVDQRVREIYVHEELSIGDYILTGGELAAMVVVDSVTRLLPGVLGCAASSSNETFSHGLLKHPQYTRPREYQGRAVPDVLLSGDHAAINRWRFVASVERTRKNRPELLRRVTFTPEEQKILQGHGIAVAPEKR